MGDWIPADGDAVARCPSPAGRVLSLETVAKFVSTAEWNSSNASLQSAALDSKYLCEKPNFSDCCGDSDGLSVQRNANWKPGEASRRLENFYSTRRGSPECVVIALVEDLRKIRLQNEPDVQVVFVLDDPGDPGGPDHAIIRIRPLSKPRPPMEFLRNAIRNNFRRISE